MEQRWKLIDGLYQFPWFTGFVDVSHNSSFKTYIAYILTHSFIKHRSNIISAHPVDYPDTSNINMRGYPFEENGYRFISINEESYYPFLGYKIETDVPDENDVGFSFNALFPKFDSFEKLKLKVDDKKWEEYLISEDGKGKIVSSLGYGFEDKEKFIRDVFKKICFSYIYKLERKSYGDQWVLKFCVCIEMSTNKGHSRKTTVVLRYMPDTGEMHIITIT